MWNMRILLNWVQELWKPALESSFYLKINNERDHLSGMVRVIEQQTVPFHQLGRCIKKSWDHCFCDYVGIVIFRFDLCWVLKDIHIEPEVNHLHPIYFRNSSKFWRTTKNVFCSPARGPLLFKNVLIRRTLWGATRKFQMVKWIMCPCCCNMALKRSLYMKNFFNLPFCPFFLLLALNKSFD